MVVRGVRCRIYVEAANDVDAVAIASSVLRGHLSDAEIVAVAVGDAYEPEPDEFIAEE